jgi:hypothetical protein
MGAFYSGPGFFSGIGYSNGIAPVNVRVTNVAVTGCKVWGIVVGYDSTVVESCTVRTTGGFGILASTVKNSTAKDCATGAIQGEQVSECRGESSSSGSGISAYTAVIVTARATTATRHRSLYGEELCRLQSLRKGNNRVVG